MQTKTKIETNMITLPAAWATALMADDYSTLAGDEANRCLRQAASLAREGWDVVDCEDEARFTWLYHIYDKEAECEGGDVLDYTLIRRTR